MGLVRGSVRETVGVTDLRPGEATCWVRVVEKERVDALLVMDCKAKQTCNRMLWCSRNSSNHQPQQSLRRGIWLAVNVFRKTAYLILSYII